MRARYESMILAPVRICRYAKGSRKPYSCWTDQNPYGKDTVDLALTTIRERGTKAGDVIELKEMLAHGAGPFRFRVTGTVAGMGVTYLGTKRRQK